MRKDRKLRSRHLNLAEISPTIHLAGCFRWEGVRHRYRIPAHDLLLIESGEIEALTADGPLKAKAGDLVCFRSTDWNEYGSAGAVVLYEAHLEFAPPPRHRLTPMLDEFGPLPLHLPLGAAFADARRVFEIFCQEVDQAGGLHRERQRAAVHELLTIVMGVLQHEKRDFKHMDAWQHLRLRLDADPRAERSVTEWAREMGLSRRYFSRAFRHRFSLTPQAYQTRVRLIEAARLLHDTDKLIKTIAFDMGFSDARIMGQLFKRHLGVLPSELRAGSKPIPAEPIESAKHLFPFQRHLVRPNAAHNWMRMLYFPRKRPRDFQMTVPFEQGRQDTPAAHRPAVKRKIRRPPSRMVTPGSRKHG